MKRKENKQTEKKGGKLVSNADLFKKLGMSPAEAQKTMRDFYHDVEAANNELELEDILKKPTLTPEEIWKITPENFFAWRKKYDYPKILAHFSKKLNQFDEWKNHYKINDEMLMQYGISNMIGSKEGKSKSKYIFQKTYREEKTNLLSFINLTNKISSMGGEPETYLLIKEFVGYIDWCNEKKIKIILDKPDQRFLAYPAMSHYDSVKVTISILDGLELLKVGGVEVMPNQHGHVNVKYFEFVNASFLKLKGSISTGGRVLKFANSFVNNLSCENLDFPMVEFSDSQVNNVNIVDSKIQQWNFYKTVVSGKIINSQLYSVIIRGGGFFPILDNTYLIGVHARHIDELVFKSTYQSLKKTYADQGDDKNAIHYFLLEKEIERISLRSSIFKHRRHSNFKESMFKKVLVWVFTTIIRSYQYSCSVLNNVYWGYGRKPFRVIGISLLFIFLCAILYHSNQDFLNMPKGQTIMSFADSIYYSTVTFTTLGYGDFTPNGFLRVISAFEAIFGGMSIGFLVAGFSNLKY